MSNNVSKFSATLPIDWRVNLRSLFVLLSLALALAIPVTAQPQSSSSKEQELGIASYKSGDTKEAIKQLEKAVKKDNADAESWYYLGLARLRKSDYKNARKALEKAAKLSPQLSRTHSALAYALFLEGKDTDAEREASQAISLNQQDDSGHYVIGALRLRQHRNAEARLEAETAIKLNPGMALAYLLKSQVLVAIYSDRAVSPVRNVLPYGPNQPLGPISEEELAERRRVSRRGLQLLGDASAALETYLSLSGTNSETELWLTQLRTLKAYSANDEGGDKIFTPAEVSTKARVLAKPEPQYTEAARQAGVMGTVLLNVVLAADGQVKHILVLRSLPLGLTQQSIAAAQKIQFVPATLDGKTVSMMVRLEYNFFLY